MCFNCDQCSRKDYPGKCQEKTEVAPALLPRDNPWERLVLFSSAPFNEYSWNEGRRCACVNSYADRSLCPASLHLTGYTERENVPCPVSSCKSRSSSLSSVFLSCGHNITEGPLLLMAPF